MWKEKTSLSKSNSLDLKKIRADFPILHRKVHGKPLVYFDNAATTQKPSQVIQAISTYYETSNANVHRGIHQGGGHNSSHADGASQQSGSLQVPGPAQETQFGIHSGHRRGVPRRPR